MRVAPVPLDEARVAARQAPAGCTATMRWPSTSTSPGNGAAPLPSKIAALAISVLSMVALREGPRARNPA